MKNVSDEYSSASVPFTSNQPSGTLVNKSAEIDSNIKRPESMSAAL